MQMICLDLEGVLVPEIWIEFSKRSGIPELARTTRDEPDYDKLMRFRIDLLAKHGLKLADIQDVIAGMGPMAGAKDFLDDLRSRYQVLILSDTFYEFAAAADAPARLADAAVPQARGRRRRASSPATCCAWPTRSATRSTRCAC